MNHLLSWIQRNMRQWNLPNFRQVATKQKNSGDWCEQNKHEDKATRIIISSTMQKHSPLAHYFEKKPVPKCSKKKLTSLQKFSEIFRMHHHLDRRSSQDLLEGTPCYMWEENIRISNWKLPYVAWLCITVPDARILIPLSWKTWKIWSETWTYYMGLAAMQNNGTAENHLPPVTVFF